MDGVRSLARRYVSNDHRHGLHMRLLESPMTRTSYLRARADIRDLAVGPGTGLVLEGYPRSANTYALSVLRVSNPGLVMAHHLHSHRSIEEGVRRGVPTVLLLRDPLGAVTSLVQKMSITPALALREYVRFHEPLVPLLKHVLVAPFPLVTREPGQFVEEVDERFGMGLAPYSGTDAEEEAARAIVHALHVENYGRVVPGAIALPTQEKSRAKLEVEVAVRREADLLAQAQRLFEATLSSR